MNLTTETPRFTPTSMHCSFNGISGIPTDLRLYSFSLILKQNLKTFYDLIKSLALTVYNLLTSPLLESYSTSNHGCLVMLLKNDKTNQSSFNNSACVLRHLP